MNNNDKVTKISILDLFDKEDLKEKNDGNYMTKCPCCGDSNDGYGGMVLFVEDNRAYCFSSKKWFTFLEVVALQKGIIKCIDGRDSK